jgi:hypothetical protein
MLFNTQFVMDVKTSGTAIHRLASYQKTKLNASHTVFTVPSQKLPITYVRIDEDLRGFLYTCVADPWKRPLYWPHSQVQLIFYTVFYKPKTDIKRGAELYS